MNTDTALRRKPRTLALELVDSLGDRIRDGSLALGDKLPTEAAIMAEFSVSRTVVREAISKLQASGLVETRHGIGTFVLGLGQAPGFKITPDQFSTLRDVIAVLELRIGVETEAAALAAQRRTEANLKAMREALDAVAAAVYPVFQQNPELAKLLLDMEALEAALKERSILIFDSRTPPFNLLTGSVTNKSNK